jgi:hypothetical protein
MERFYCSIHTEGRPPIPYREIILTARIVDAIFTQIYPAQERSNQDRDQEREKGI